jgi:hypothetical protein
MDQGNKILGLSHEADAVHEADLLVRNVTIPFSRGMTAFI